MKTIFRVSFLILILLSSYSLVLAGSKADAKYNADRYREKAMIHYSNKSYLSSEKFFLKALNTGVKPKGSFYFFYAKVLAMNGKYNQSKTNIEKYIKIYGKKAKYLKEANNIIYNINRKLREQAQQNKKNRIKKITSGTPKMIKIDAGSFNMGSTIGEDDHKPAHKVKIRKGFAISQFEVTFKQYDRFARSTKRDLPNDSGWGRGNRPVINVSLHDAEDYCEWLSKKNNRDYRLPTEAEWEYVSSLSKVKKFGFKSLIGMGDSNCDDCRYFWESPKTKTVGNYAANALDLYDIFGNVWEWTCSAYNRDGYKFNTENRCVTKGRWSGKTAVMRGGSWNSSKQILRPYIRQNNFPSYRSNQVGFRILEEL